MSLAARWAELRGAEPQLRIRDAAERLAVSEAELLATTVGDTAVRLGGDLGELVRGLPEVGRCMALTRNPHAVSEVRGRYGGVELGPHAGQVVGEHVDLRVFMGQWAWAFAVDEPHPRDDGARRHSVHVFDASGTAVHKVYLEPDGDVAAWQALIASHLDRSPPALVVTPPPAREPARADHQIEVEALRAEWDAMTDTHEFFFLLRKHQVTRTQALRLAGTDRARPTRVDALAQVLGDAAETATKIMIFVGNRGCIQVFSGEVAKIKRMGPWLNVLDPGFNLHLREDRVAEAWIVAKPTRSGVVTSLELYDADGENIALVFRKRDDRAQAEDPAWSALLARLPAAP